MPYRPMHACSEPGCPALTLKRFCEQHAKADRQRSEAQRLSARDRGYTRHWELARTRYLRAHPLCVQCEHEGRITAATVVDHIEPHKGDRVKFWDETNWQPLCPRHHNQKTAQEGAWGR